MPDPIAASGPRPIRMLYFVREEFPTYRVDVDVLFGSELMGRGNRIDLVMQAKSPSVATGAHEWHGAKVFVGPTREGNAVNRILKQWLGFWHDLRYLGRAFKKQYDAVQVRDKFLIAALASIVARMRGLKFFFWLSFPYPEDDIIRAREGNSRLGVVVHARGMLCSWLLYRWILPRCDHAFVQSRQMREDVCQYGIDPAKVSPVPMGIAGEEIEKAPSSVQRTDASAETVVAYLGTLNGQRRLEILVDMLALLRRQGLQVKLLLIGDGDLPNDRLKLERRAEELQVRDYMEITGFLPRHEALERMRVADICVSPFFPTPVLKSTSPTKLVEYMAYEFPVIANDHPEQSLILRESRAGVCVPWHARHFARAVRWLICIGAQRRRDMGGRGRAWVIANRTYSRIADELEGKYRQLLGI